MKKPLKYFANDLVSQYMELGLRCRKPSLNIADDESICVNHEALGNYNLYVKDEKQILFCDNETNYQRLYRLQTVLLI